MSGTSLSAARILLIIGGGVAAYKALDLIRRLRERGAKVRVIMTRAAKQFVTPLSAASLSSEKVYDDLFSLTDEAEMGHIESSRRPPPTSSRGWRTALPTIWRRQPFWRRIRRRCLRRR